jgi:hypothetical protein
VQRGASGRRAGAGTYCSEEDRLHHWQPETRHLLQAQLQTQTTIRILLHPHCPHCPRSPHPTGFLSPHSPSPYLTSEAQWPLGSAGVALGKDLMKSRKSLNCHWLACHRQYYDRFLLQDPKRDRSILPCRLKAVQH